MMADGHSYITSGEDILYQAAYASFSALPWYNRAYDDCDTIHFYRTGLYGDLAAMQNRCMVNAKEDRLET